MPRIAGLAWQRDFSGVPAAWPIVAGAEEGEVRHHGRTSRPQFDALSPRDSVVTITIGGNDIGFASILAECVTLSATSPSGHPCKRHFTTGGTDRLAATVRAVAPKIATALRGIHHRAPRAHVLLVGYPDGPG